jgi:pilus assembly protein CpaE
MADKSLDQLVKQAQKAYENRDRRTGSQLIDQVLKKDFNYPGAWQLLYRYYGAGQPLETFKESFARQYYPDSVAQLQSTPAVITKPSFLQRLFGSSRSKSKTTPQIPASGSPAQPAPAKPQSLQPAPVSKTQAASDMAQPATALDLPSPSPSPVIPAPAIPAPVFPATLAADEIPKPVPGPLLKSAAAMSVTSSSSSPARPGSLLSPRPSGSVAPVAPIQAYTGGPKIQVMIVDDIPQTRETVVRSLRFQDDMEIIGQATNGIQAIQKAKQLQPDVIVMDVNMPDMDGITATAAIKREVPHTEIIILTVQDDIDYLRRSMMAGARDFLAKPPMIEDLISAIQRAAVFARRSREASKQVVTVAQAAAMSAVSTGKIITVFSPRGGIGSTTIAANLAAVLHTDETPVGLVDGNLQYGDLPVLFNVQVKNSIADLAPKVSELDPELVEEVMIKHSSGLKILGPPRPERAELVAGPHFSQLLEYLSQLYSYIVVDTNHRMGEVTSAALGVSDLILLVVSQDVPCLARVRKWMEMLPIWNIDPRRVLMVVNPYDKRINIPPEKLSETFHLELGGVIPLDSETIIPAVNRGTPYMLQRETMGKPIAQATKALADAVKNKLAELEKPV